MKSLNKAVLFCAFAALGSACSPEDQSLVVVSVDGPLSVSPVYYLSVVVSNDGLQEPHQFPTGHATTPITLPTSFGFHVPRSRNGPFTLTVNAFNSQMHPVGSGSGEVTLKVGDRVDVCIGLNPTCTTGSGDAGVASGDSSSLPGSGGSGGGGGPLKGGLPSGSLFSTVSAGTDHSCAIGVDTSLWCWGSNALGQLGSGESTDGLLPLQAPGTSWTAVTAGYMATCAVQSSGALWCWGNNGSGQLGTGQAAKSVGIPMQIGTTGWASAALAYYHAAGVQQDGSLWTWGDNSSDQLGDPAAPSTGRATPGSINGTQWATVSAANLHTCATQTDNTLWCWGNNTSGELGDGTNRMRTSPTPVTGTDWAAVSAGFYHTCAVKTDGTLWCWGDNTEGQLGLGTNAASTTPVQVIAGAAKWTTVSAGQSHTCALQADGTLWCWGGNASGQLGTGSNLPSAAPVALAGLPATWVAVAAGGEHTCAVAGDGTLWCWGLNVKGQLGLGSAGSQVTPTRLGA